MDFKTFATELGQTNCLLITT